MSTRALARLNSSWPGLIREQSVWGESPGRRNPESIHQPATEICCPDIRVSSKRDRICVGAPGRGPDCAALNLPAPERLTLSFRPSTTPSLSCRIEVDLSVLPERITGSLERHGDNSDPRRSLVNNPAKREKEIDMADMQMHTARRGVCKRFEQKGDLYVLIERDAFSYLRDTYVMRTMDLKRRLVPACTLCAWSFYFAW
jgi:hypothetical protein